MVSSEIQGILNTYVIHRDYTVQGEFKMNSHNTWHIASWPPLAWVETGIKTIALILGIVAGVQALTEGVFTLPAGFRLAQTILLGLLSLGLIVAIFDRIIERELVAMIFVIVNNLGHWGMVVSLASGSSRGLMLVAFSILMLAGDIVKLVFLNVHDFRVRDTSPAAMFGLTSIYVIGYAIILTIELFLT